MERAAVPSMIREQRLNQWIEDYSDSIMRTCFLYLSDQTQAEDAAQDTWIKAWKHMGDFERKGIANEKVFLKYPIQKEPSFLRMVTSCELNTHLSL